ncbi:MAG: hypothetical protein VB855_10015 [Pirellulaceae bacterium]
MMYIRKRGKVSGPHDEELLRSMVHRGQITLLDEASEDGTEWEPADSFSWFQPESRVVSSDETDEGAGETDELDLESHLVEESEEDELLVDFDAFDTPQDAPAPAAPLQLDDPQQLEEEPVTGMDGFSLSSLASGSSSGTASPAPSFHDDLVIAEEPEQVSSGDSNWQSYSQPPQVAREEFELIDMGEEEEEGAGSSSRKGSSSLIVLGYIAGFLSLFVVPALLGLVGVVCGMINFSQEEHVHGAAQIAIAIVCTILGLVVFQ